MMGNEKLLNEIMENASLIPLECQEHILDLLKAMVFTRKVCNKDINIPNDNSERTS